MVDTGPKVEAKIPQKQFPFYIIFLKSFSLFLSDHSQTFVRGRGDIKEKLCEKNCQVLLRPKEIEGFLSTMKSIQKIYINLIENHVNSKFTGRKKIHDFNFNLLT